MRPSVPPETVHWLFSHPLQHKFLAVELIKVLLREIVPALVLPKLTNYTHC